MNNAKKWKSFQKKEEILLLKECTYIVDTGIISVFPFDLGSYIIFQLLSVVSLPRYFILDISELLVDTEDIFNIVYTVTALA